MENLLKTLKIQRVFPLLLAGILWLTGLHWTSYGSPCCLLGYGNTNHPNIRQNHGTHPPKGPISTHCCARQRHHDSPSLQTALEANCPCHVLPLESPKAATALSSSIPQNGQMDFLSPLDIGLTATHELLKNLRSSLSNSLYNAYRAPPINHRHRYLDLQKLLH